MLEPIVKTVTVPCTQEQAFTTFLEQITNWWPLDKFTVSAMNGRPAQTIRVETEAGGDIVEVGADGSEVSWGTVLQYEPFTAISMDFHIPRVNEQVEERSLVELKFDTSSDGTHIEFRQSRWEAFGQQAEMMRGGYDQGWTYLFEQLYRAACGP